MDPELRDESPSAAGSPAATFVHPESPPAGFPSAISQQAGHNDGAQDNLARKEEEVDHLLEKLRDAEKMMQIEMSRIRLEAMKGGGKKKKREDQLQVVFLQG